MNRCQLEGYGECSGGMSREHYISASVLRYMNQNGGLKIGGLSWQPPQHLQPVGIKALQSKILCVLYNSNLSPLDSTGEKHIPSDLVVDRGASSVRGSLILGFPCTPYPRPRKFP
jgi:hypothetical protein